MTREGIIKLAREVGLYDCIVFGRIESKDTVIERFAALVVAAEREECAKLCEAYTDNDDGRFIDYEGHGYECAAAIRARGQS